MRTPWMVALGAVALGGLAGAATADIVHLHTGYRLEGEVVETPESVMVRTRGGKVWLRPSQVVRIERRETPGQQFARERAILLRERPNDLDARVELGRRAQARGLRQQAKDEWNAVLAADPGHPDAHRALGHVWHEGRWMTPRARHLALGHQQRDGEWLTPAQVQALEAQAQTAADAERRRAQARLVDAQVRAAEADAERATAQAELARAEANQLRDDADRWHFDTVILGRGRPGRLFGTGSHAGATQRPVHAVDPHTRQRYAALDRNDPHTRARTVRTGAWDPHSRLRAPAHTPRLATWSRLSGAPLTALALHGVRLSPRATPADESCR